MPNNQREAPLAPLMGWSSWNQFRQHITEEKIINNAGLLKEKGLLDAGYQYVNVDDCWQQSARNVNGCLAFDLGRFPSDGDGLVKQLNRLGFRAGIYSSCGRFTCEDMPGSYDYEHMDAKRFIDWGFEYLKYDYCHVVDISTDPHYKGDYFATTTPPILSFGLVKIVGQVEEVILAKETHLTGGATLDSNDAIVGLAHDEAAVTLKVTVEKEGIYPFSITYVKTPFAHRRFAQVMTKSDRVNAWFEPTSGWSDTGRVNVELKLAAGENDISITNPMKGQMQDTCYRYERMREALDANKREDLTMYFAICEHGRTKPWEWASLFAGSWRTTHDIHASWIGIMNCYEGNADLWSYQSPGHYNDPDMLEVGVAKLSDEQALSHFALWCMMSAPLVLGMDVAKLTEKDLAIITNQALIGLNQDKRLMQASRHKLTESADLLIKPLSDNKIALCFFNKSDTPKDASTFDFDEILPYDPRINTANMTITGTTDLLKNVPVVTNHQQLEVPLMLPHEVKIFVVDYKDSPET